jgi:hypothetical protein
VPRREQTDGLDRLGGECESVDGLRLGMEDGQAGRDGQGVADDQAREQRTRGGERCDGRRSQRQHDRKRRKPYGGRYEAKAGSRPLREMLRRERGVYAGADPTDDDEKVAGDHLTITSPSMSWRWSVQT